MRVPSSFLFPIVDGDWNTNIEAAIPPVFHFYHTTHVRRGEIKTTSNNSFHPIASSFKHREMPVPEMSNSSASGRWRSPWKVTARPGLEDDNSKFRLSQVKIDFRACVADTTVK
ncbi:hypothetical protein CISG_06709 [Coccidioides immitis RMSCC 3703]|uniref:Uncharacterized protein n=2 Tax=Coccidioides immitis TaxID=5501 RepID=A0A0J8QZF4_COCIT|nr:hypothetical protein CIRG_05241 [Coccidioides immitis RMSCC 2394]KMU77866.1 hypothetical protein CISG_06709 [Coccidioides immitis RMSCC 3703]